MDFRELLQSERRESTDNKSPIRTDFKLDANIGRGNEAIDHDLVVQQGYQAWLVEAFTTVLGKSWKGEDPGTRKGSSTKEVSRYRQGGSMFHTDRKGDMNDSSSDLSCQSPNAEDWLQIERLIASRSTPSKTLFMGNIPKRFGSQPDELQLYHVQLYLKSQPGYSHVSVHRSANLRFLVHYDSEIDATESLANFNDSRFSPGRCSNILVSYYEHPISMEYWKQASPSPPRGFTTLGTAVATARGYFVGHSPNARNKKAMVIVHDDSRDGGRRDNEKTWAQRAQAALIIAGAITDFRSREEAGPLTGSQSQASVMGLDENDEKGEGTEGNAQKSDSRDGPLNLATSAVDGSAVNDDVYDSDNDLSPVEIDDMSDTDADRTVEAPPLGDRRKHPPHDDYPTIGPNFKLPSLEMGMRMENAGSSLDAEPDPPPVYSQGLEDITSQLQQESDDTVLSAMDAPFAAGALGAADAARIDEVNEVAKEATPDAVDSLDREDISALNSTRFKKPSIETSLTAGVHRNTHQPLHDGATDKPDLERMTTLHEPYLSDVEHMQEQIEHVWRGIGEFLDLKRRMEAMDRVATTIARTSQTTVVLTATTAIFLPLSFVVAFYGLSLQSNVRQHGANAAWTLYSTKGLPHNSSAKRSAFVFEGIFVVGIALACLAVALRVSIPELPRHTARLALHSPATHRTRAGLGETALHPTRGSEKISHFARCYR